MSPKSKSCASSSKKDPFIIRLLVKYKIHLRANNSRQKGCIKNEPLEISRVLENGFEFRIMLNHVLIRYIP